MNSTNVPETLRLCRGCKSSHYWDKRKNVGVDAATVPQPSFVDEELCPGFRFGGAK